MIAFIHSTFPVLTVCMRWFDWFLWSNRLVSTAENQSGDLFSEPCIVNGSIRRVAPLRWTQLSQQRSKDPKVQNPTRV
jgi:hypothetical protein